MHPIGYLVVFVAAAIAGTLNAIAGGGSFISFPTLLFLGMPVKVLVGLFALSVWVAGFGPPARRLYESIYQAWSAWFAGGLR